MYIKLGEFCKERDINVEQAYKILKALPGDIVDKGMYAGPETATFSDKNLDKVLNALDGLLDDYNARLEKEKKDLHEKAEQERIRLEELNNKAEKLMEKQREKDQTLSKILISSGFSFDGYNIVKYSGYISGDDTVQINRSALAQNYNPQQVCDALVKIRAQALRELKEAAYNLDCNAVIGVDFDYMTFESESANLNGGTTYYPYVICVTANGNAVVIEKE